MATLSRIVELCLLLPSLCHIAVAVSQGDLANYKIASFSYEDPHSNPNAKFNHFTIDQESGDVYVGAVNRLFRLNSSFDHEKNITTYNNTDRPDRDSNYNKILIIYPPLGLITCDSENNGQCQLRNLIDLSVIMSTVYPVTSIAEKASVATIGPGRNQKDYLYVGATFDQSDRRNIPLISRRRLKYGSGFLAASSEYDIVFGRRYLADTIINYIKVFSFRGFTYFVSFHLASKLSRVCQDGANLDSYTEITLQCSGSDGSVTAWCKQLTLDQQDLI
ncbi:plexin-B-like [Patiria miniata]|uniref:Sema domain-containing protein n=1 Tax=Patiria miniata TaxID=46514 RepID=A0A913ZQF5_PATMI|nr:plexin-B-like [Patiria miniata]